MSTVRVMLHGGAGRALKDPSRKPLLRERLRRVTEVLVTALDEGQGAVEVVALGCRLLEDDPNFNAGTGSAIQSDGQIRMSASLMDGESMQFLVWGKTSPVMLAAWYNGNEIQDALDVGDEPQVQYVGS